MATQSQRNAPHVEPVTPQVTIIDPTHPFFGHTFPLVRRNSPDGQAQVSLLRPNGQHRQVP
ncbi:MAG: hypothetical protein HYR94_19725, partial [Chloroflexi bacterium]|nr:hypothetical protein [Chloroflexota bacterium]